jgi:hypothetical protein
VSVALSKCDPINVESSLTAKPKNRHKYLVVSGISGEQDVNAWRCDVAWTVAKAFTASIFKVYIIQRHIQQDARILFGFA